MMYHKTMKKALVLFLILISSVSLFSMSSREKTDLIISMDTDGELNLNPYVATDSTSIIILQNLYEGLFCYNGRTGEAENALAESYSVSEDGLTWTFTILDSRFSDGSKITAQTFETSWNFLKSGPLVANLDYIKSFRAKDSKTLEVQLYSIFPALPQLLCQPCLAAIKDKNSFSGAYCIDFLDESRITLKRNHNYRGEVKTDSITVLLDELEPSLFESGEICWTTTPVENSEFMIVSPLYATNYFWFTNTGVAGRDKELRTALTSIIPLDVIRYLQNTILPTDSLVPGSGLTAQPEEGAYSLLSRENLPKLSIGIHRGSQTIQSAELIADLWSRVFGLTVTLDVVPVSVYMDNPQNNPYDFCAVTWIGDYYDPVSFLSLFKGSSDEFDSLMDLASKADSETRKDLLAKAEKVLLDGCTVIPVSNSFATNFVRTDLIEGWYPNQLDIHPFKDLYQK